jgi:diguanylate cyclase (GGDEF)-like protein
VNRSQFELQLYRHAFFDDLTGLPNRRLVLQSLDELIARGEGGVGAIYVDVDDFALVNDCLGHEVGDLVLALVAKRVGVALGGGDVLGRVGADQFVAVCAPRPDRAALAELARTIVSSLRPAFRVDRHDVYVTASAGVASYGPHTSNALDLLRQADTALHRAKSAGKGNVEVFHPVMQAQLAERLDIQSGLRQALATDEICAYYQPIVDLATGATVRFEALARWLRPGFGVVAPATFIEVAESTGLIVALGERMIAEAMADCARWQARWPGVGVAVNISPRQLELADIAGTVASALSESGLSPGMVTLEITESVQLNTSGVTSGTLADLHDLGVRLAIDDFGTGYSSLSYLHRLPIDELKVDKAFIDWLEPSPTVAALLTVIAAAGQALGVEVVAEGIDSQEKLRAVRAIGCRYGQGFLLGEPRPIRERALEISQ